MENILVLGSGKIGTGIAQSLIDSGDFHVALGDADAQALAVRAPKGAETLVVDAVEPETLEAAMSGRWAVINALPFFLNAKVAAAARAQGLHYFDLSEDILIDTESATFSLFCIVWRIRYQSIRDKCVDIRVGAESIDEL